MLVSVVDDKYENPDLITCWTLFPLTCDDDLDEVSVLQLVVVRQMLQQLLGDGLMSEEQNLLPDAHHAAVWSLNRHRHRVPG